MPYQAFDELVKLTGLPEPDAGQIEIAGRDPVMQTRYRVGTTGAAAHAAVGHAVSELWKLRSGRGQSVRVDMQAAGYALRGQHFTDLDGVPVRTISPRDPWFTYYPLRDGRYMCLHTNFPHHRDVALKLLGWPKDIEEAKLATAKWDGIELENAIFDNGASAGFVRTPAEWAQHPQSAAVATQPLLEIVKIGDAPPEPLSGNRPLAGVRALDLTRVLAGPTAARTLAEHGADVMKIHGAHLPNTGVGELDTGLGKLSAFLDLRTPSGMETLRGLVREADIFSQSYRPGTLAARGLSPEEAAKLRPGIVYVELRAWGTAGPWKDRRGFDTVVQAVSGMAHTQGNGVKPSRLPVSANDYIAGYLMALGTIVALRRRAIEGGSWHVRTSLARVGQWITERGLVDAAEVAQVPAIPNSDQIAHLLQETVSPAGRIRHLKPVVELSETPPYWARPPVPLGYNDPVWPARENLSAV